MIIPKYLQRPGMSKDDIKRLEAFVADRRKRMKDAPTFNTTAAAMQAAVAMWKKDNSSIPSVWKEPKDIGTKYAVVHIQDREDAAVAGYTEVFDQQTVVDKSRGVRKADIDEIEEV